MEHDFGLTLRIGMPLKRSQTESICDLWQLHRAISLPPDRTIDWAQLITHAPQLALSRSKIPRSRVETSAPPVSMPGSCVGVQTGRLNLPSFGRVDEISFQSSEIIFRAQTTLRV